MNRHLLALVLVAICCAALWSPGSAHAAGIARPNPALIGLQVDYVNALASATGGVASLPPLDGAVIEQSVADRAFLSFLRRDDLGGFLPAPIGASALSSGGRKVVGLEHRLSQIPQFARAARGSVLSFAFTGGGGPTPPPDQGLGPVPGLGTPPAVTPPTNDNTVPPPNQGFGGSPAPTTPGAATTRGGETTKTTPKTTTTTTKTTGRTTTTQPTTTTRTPPPTTTATVPTTTGTVPATTTAPTTIAAATTSTAATTTTPAPPHTSCGTVGLHLDSNLVGCRIYVTNMAPGGSATELMTVRNDSGAPFTLELKADGTPNQLWNDLQMGVWDVTTPAPAPLPPLLFWTTQFNALGTLQADESVTFRIELALPLSAGNADQGRSASIDFIWHATG
jgi:hypothetical protein